MTVYVTPWECEALKHEADFIHMMREDATDDIEFLQDIDHELELLDRDIKDVQQEVDELNAHRRRLRIIKDMFRREAIT